MNHMAIADTGAPHVILAQTALYDDKPAKPVNLRVAAREINAVEAHREILAEHVTIPLCPLGRIIRKLQLIAVWTPPDLDSELCEYIRYSTWTHAMSDQRRYTIFYCSSVLDATPSSTTPA